MSVCTHMGVCVLHVAAAGLRASGESCGRDGNCCPSLTARSSPPTLGVFVCCLFVFLSPCSVIPACVRCFYLESFLFLDRFLPLLPSSSLLHPETSWVAVSPSRPRGSGPADLWLWGWEGGIWMDESSCQGHQCLRKTA